MKMKLIWCVKHPQMFILVTVTCQLLLFPVDHDTHKLFAVCGHLKFEHKATEFLSRDSRFVDHAIGKVELSMIEFVGVAVYWEEWYSVISRQNDVIHLKNLPSWISRLFGNVRTSPNLI